MFGTPHQKTVIPHKTCSCLACIATCMVILLGAIAATGVHVQMTGPVICVMTGVSFGTAAQHCTHVSQNIPHCNPHSLPLLTLLCWQAAHFQPSISRKTNGAIQDAKQQCTRCDRKLSDVNSMIPASVAKCGWHARGLQCRRNETYATTSGNIHNREPGMSHGYLSLRPHSVVHSCTAHPYRCNTSCLMRAVPTTLCTPLH